MTSRDKRLQKLDRIARVILGKMKDKNIEKHSKKTLPTPKNPQRKNKSRRVARKGGKNAYANFLRVNSLKNKVSL